MHRFVIVAYKKLILAIVIILLLFSTPLQNVMPGALGTLIKNADELFACVSIIFLLSNIKYLTKNSTPARLGLIFLIFLVWGLFCTLVNGEQKFSAVILDIINCSKFMLTFLGMYCYARSVKDSKWLKRHLGITAKIVLFILLAYCLFSMATGGLSTGVQLFGSHAVNISHIGVGLITIILYANDGNNVKVWAVLSSLLCVSSMTAKGLAIAIVILLLVFFKGLYEKRRKWFFGLLLVIVLVVISFDSIQTFFLNDTAARAILLKNALNIAIENFGLGLGYAMYGTAQAASSYSPVYYELGFNNRYGMTPTNFSYLTDSFWPAVIGQFGFVGLIIFAVLVVKFFAYIIGMEKRDKNLFVTAILIFGYLLIMTTSSTAFFNPIAVPFAAILGFISAEYEKKESIK